MVGPRPRPCRYPAAQRAGRASAWFRRGSRARLPWPDRPRHSGRGRGSRSPCSTSRVTSSFMPDMPGSRPPVAARHFGPALGLHQLRPAAVELTVVALAHAKIAGPGVEALVKALVPKPHLRVNRHAPRHHPATSAGAFLPIVHVVLLKRARRAEAAHPGSPHRFLDVPRRRLIDIDP